MAKLKKGQSKYMPHLRLRATKSINTGMQVLGRAGRVGHIPNAPVENEYGIKRSAEEMKTKGKFGGLCNRSCCLRTESFWYNRGSYAYYCEDCARLINEEFRFRDDVELYGSLLVKPPADLVAEVRHGNEWVLIYSDGSEKRFDNEEEAKREHEHYRRVTGLRSDGSTPLWFNDLAARYENLRTQVTIKDSR